MHYRYEDISEFEEQLQYDLDRRFEYFDEIEKPVKFSLSCNNYVVSVTVAEVTYKFDEDQIQIVESSDIDDMDMELDLDDLDLDDDFLKKYLGKSI